VPLTPDALLRLLLEPIVPRLTASLAAMPTGSRVAFWLDGERLHYALDPGPDAQRADTPPPRANGPASSPPTPVPLPVPGATGLVAQGTAQGGPKAR
jgi:hypothetical protein